MSKKYEQTSAEVDKALRIGSVIECFTIEDAKEMVNAWERLEGGRNYSPKDIERWLINDMKPVIDKFRAKIKNAL